MMMTSVPVTCGAVLTPVTGLAVLTPVAGGAVFTPVTGAGAPRYATLLMVVDAGSAGTVPGSLVWMSTRNPFSSAM